MQELGYYRAKESNNSELICAQCFLLSFFFAVMKSGEDEFCTVTKRSHCFLQKKKKKLDLCEGFTVTK